MACIPLASRGDRMGRFQLAGGVRGAQLRVLLIAAAFATAPTASADSLPVLALQYSADTGANIVGAGQYAARQDYVNDNLVGTRTRVQIPVNALLFRSEGLRAVVIDANHKTRLQPLTIGRDFGTSLEVLQGLAPSDWIVLNPQDSLEDNQQVNVREASVKVPLASTVPPVSPAAPGSPKGSGK